MRARRQRTWALLARRGFDSDVIEQAMRETPAAGRLESLEPETDDPA